MVPAPNREFQIEEQDVENLQLFTEVDDGSDVLPYSVDIDDDENSFVSNFNATDISQETEIVHMTCHNCGELLEATVKERPVKIECWNCGIMGIIE